MLPFESPEVASSDECLRAAAALLQVGARDLAEAVLWGAVARHPELPEVAFRLLEAAAGAEDRALVERLAEGVINRFSRLPEAWVVSQRALRQAGLLEEAARVGDTAVATYPEDVAVLLERANTAELARDLTGVKVYCGRVRGIDPRNGDALTIEMRASRGWGDEAHVDALVQDVLNLGVETAGALVEVIYAAARRGNDALLFATSERLIATAPWVLEAYLTPLYRLLGAAAYEEAERMLARVPADLTLRAEIDWIAVLLLTQQERREEAYLRSVAATERHPGDGALHGFRATLTRELRDEAELEAYLNETYPKFPTEIRLATEYAMIAERRGDPVLALERWSRVQAAAPAQPDGYANRVRLLLQLERLEEAENDTKTALARFPNDRSIRMQHAIAATKRMDWEEAHRRWTAFDALYPDDPDARHWVAEARAVRALSRLDAGAAASPARTPMAELFMRFEGIGTHCEFGLVQRHFGAEPLGLLRWASPAAEGSLALMFEHGLAGVGDPENVLLRVDRNGEYAAGDRRYFVGHTFISAASTPEAQMRRTMTRRLKFLKDKLLADLAEGEKIFVYLEDADALTHELMQRLHSAIRRYGKGVLFCVRKGQGVSRNGAVTRLGEGFFLGEILAPAGEGQEPKLHAETWAAMCQAVVAEAFGGQ